MAHTSHASGTEPCRGRNRRAFLRRSLAAGAAALSTPAILRAENRGDKLRIAVIGCGGRGAANLAGVAGEQVVALCDVNSAAIGSAAAKAPAARHFADFRRRLRKQLIGLSLECFHFLLCIRCHCRSSCFVYLKRTANLTQSLR